MDVFSDKYYIVDKDGKYNLVDRNGKLVSDNWFERIEKTDKGELNVKTEKGQDVVLSANEINPSTISAISRLDNVRLPKSLSFADIVYIEPFILKGSMEKTINIIAKVVYNGEELLISENGMLYTSDGQKFVERPLRNTKYKYKPRNREELKRIVAEQIELQGGEVVDLNMIDTILITDMSDMFYGCSGLTSLDVSTWDTSNVTDMRDMFTYCPSLKSLNVSTWDTSNVIDMSGMSNCCPKLTNLDLSKWDTSKVTDMRAMFYCCERLTSLDVSNWDTSKVKYTRDMFDGCNQRIIPSWYR